MTHRFTDYAIAARRTIRPAPPTGVPDKFPESGNQRAPHHVECAMTNHARSAPTLIARAALLAHSICLAHDDEGKLIMYDMESEVGTVACREFRDDAGRLTKRIYYTLARPASRPASSPADSVEVQSFSFDGPFDPNKLVASGVETYDHDVDGRVVRESSLSPTGVLRSFRSQEYARDGTRSVSRSFKPDGRRVSETHYEPRGHIDAQMTFDQSGRRVVRLTGRMPDDEQWVKEWGPASNGLMCRIDANNTSARLGQMSVTVSVRRLPGGRAAIVGDFSVATVRPQLRDLAGKLVPIDQAALRRRHDELKRTNSLFQPRPIPIGDGESAWAGSFELRDWYPNLEPGWYRLTIERRSTGEAFDLESNGIPIAIEYPRIGPGP